MPSLEMFDYKKDNKGCVCVCVSLLTDKIPLSRILKFH